MCDKDALAELLDAQREAVVRKTAGLSNELAHRRLLPSATTVAGAVKHLTFVERWWFGGHIGGGPMIATWNDGENDFEWRVSDDDQIVDLVAGYRDEAERSRKVVEVTPLADGTARDLRWVMLHMIEETARHAGHVDILRELLDGRTGI